MRRDVRRAEEPLVRAKALGEGGDGVFILLLDGGDVDVRAVRWEQRADAEERGGRVREDRLERARLDLVWRDEAQP